MVDDEIEQIIAEDLSPMRDLLKNDLPVIDEEQETREIEQTQNADDYDLTKGEILTNLTLEIGSKKISRFSCVYHKINIVLRKTIKQSPRLVKVLASLSKFASDIRKSVNKSRIFQKKKNRLRIENATRWSSSCLMLHCYYKAYLKGCFEGISFKIYL